MKATMQRPSTEARLMRKPRIVLLSRRKILNRCKRKGGRWGPLKSQTLSARQTPPEFNWPRLWAALPIARAHDAVESRVSHIASEILSTHFDQREGACDDSSDGAGLRRVPSSRRVEPMVRNHRTLPSPSMRTRRER